LQPKEVTRRETNRKVAGYEQNPPRFAQNPPRFAQNPPRFVENPPRQALIIALSDGLTFFLKI